jgi:hypothetical protein
MAVKQERLTDARQGADQETKQGPIDVDGSFSHRGGEDFTGVVEHRSPPR